MAKIKEMPSEAIIGGFKGNIDYYYWKGIACCRAWPKSPGKNRNENVMAGWSSFSYISKSWNTLSPSLQRLYVSQAAGTPLSGRDMFTRSYLSGLYAYPTGV